MGAAAVSHDLRHVGEIDVHQVALHRDDLGDALGRRTQNVVGLAERLLERQASVYFENILVIDDQQRIHVLPQLLDAPESLLVADLAFDGQRRSDDRHGQQSHLLGQLGDDGRRARTRSAAHARRDEEHARPRLFEVLTNLRQRLHGRAAAVFRVVSGPQSLCAEAYLQLHGTLVQRLLVGVTNQKRHTPYTEVPHMVHGIAAGTADAHHHNDRTVRLRGFDLRHQFVCHISNSFLHILNYKSFPQPASRLQFPTSAESRRPNLRRHPAASTHSRRPFTVRGIYRLRHPALRPQSAEFKKPLPGVPSAAPGIRGIRRPLNPAVRISPGCPPHLQKPLPGQNRR